MERPTVRLLGAIEFGGGLGLAGVSTKERALFARLALNVGHSVSAERLLDELWGEAVPRSARNALQVYVSHLRRAVGSEWITTNGGGYTLALTEEDIDISKFATLVSSGAELLAERQFPAAMATLDEALELWSGDPLPGLTQFEFARRERVRISDTYLDAVEHLAKAALQCDRSDRVLAEFSGLVDHHPFREGLRAVVMQALYQQGRAGDALNLYRSGQKILRDELGSDPGSVLQAMHAAILAEDPALIRPPASTIVGWGRAPAPATALFGREAELSHLTQLVEDRETRIVTMLGTGGVGKTRLALELANRPMPVFGDAVVYVPLADIDDSAWLLPSIAAALRLSTPQVTLEDLVSVLDAAPVLLILDNMEHLLPAARAVVSEIVARCRTLTLVATSRVALRVPGEHRLELHPFEMPDGKGVETAFAYVANNPAVSLFVARAAEVKPGFGLTAGVAGTVEAICRKLDGLPLAVELAAARVGVLGVDGVLARLGTNIDLLSNSLGEGTERHGSIRATLDWSYRLLSPDSQRLLSVLNVFKGGFTFDAVENVGARIHDTMSGPSGPEMNILDAFEQLRDASLVTDDSCAGRFRMHAVVADYAAELLRSDHERADELRVSHFEYYQQLVNARWPSFPLWPRTPEEADWFVTEQENVRVAMSRAHVVDRVDVVADLATGTAGHWESIGQWDAVKPFLEASAREAAVGRRQVDAQIWLAMAATERDSLIESEDFLAQAVRALADPPQDDARLALALAQSCQNSILQNRPEQAAIEGFAAIDASQHCHDDDVRAKVLSGAATAFAATDTSRAIGLCEQAAMTARTAGNQHLQMVGLNNLGVVLTISGDAQQALAKVDEALELPLAQRPSADRAFLSSVRMQALIVLGEFARARAGLAEAFESAIRAGLTNLVGENTLYAAIVSLNELDFVGAAVWLGLHEKTLAELGSRRVPPETQLHDRYLGDLTQRLGEVAHFKCKDFGASMSNAAVLRWIVEGIPPTIYEELADG